MDGALLTLYCLIFNGNDYFNLAIKNRFMPSEDWVIILVLLVRVGYSLETYRIIGFAITNGLAAFAGIMMAETSGFADVGMGYGMTLTGIGTIILGRQLFLFISKKQHFRIMTEFFSALLGCSILLLRP